MENDICPKSEKCPLFSGEMLVSPKAQEIYVDLYCKRGEAGRNRCKRYQVSQLYGKPHDKLMPNDKRTVEEIIEAQRNGIF